MYASRVTIRSWGAAHACHMHVRCAADLHVLSTWTHLRAHTLSCSTDQDVLQAGTCMSGIRLCAYCKWEYLHLSVCVSSLGVSFTRENVKCQRHKRRADKVVVSVLRSPRSHHGDGRMKPPPVGEEEVSKR